MDIHFREVGMTEKKVVYLGESLVDVQFRYVTMPGKKLVI
jgi:hypothetical protein